MIKQTETILPEIVVQRLTTTHGTFSLEPLPPGFGITFGSALRRTLFAGEEGHAITHVRFHPTVPHEFAAIDGVQEDVQNIILNLKQVRLKKTADTKEDKILVSLKNTTTFQGSDITKSSSSFEVINGDLRICHMEKDINLEIELTIGRGKGYEPAEEHKPDEQIYGFFPIDANFAPVKNVVINIENMLVDKRTDYERLLITIETDGSIKPQKALKNAAALLKNTLAIIASNDLDTTKDTNEDAESLRKDKLRIEELMQKPLVHLGLSARVVNSLNAHGIECLKDIVGKKTSDLLLLPNFGKKCLQDLEEFLQAKSISWNTNDSDTP